MMPESIRHCRTAETPCTGCVRKTCVACRTKHGYADSDILSTAGIADPVERVHCKVLQPRRPGCSHLPLCRQQCYVIWSMIAKSSTDAG